MKNDELSNNVIKAELLSMSYIVSRYLNRLGIKYTISEGTHF